MMLNVEKFTDKAEIYERYRPSYPNQFIEYLYSKTGFKKGSIIADIGSGTGILSRQLLKKGSKVIGVEPNESMRRVAEVKMQEFHNFLSVNGTERETNIPANSVDFITAAQSFHYFDTDRFRLECKRILKPYGKVVLVWNSRVTSSELIIANGKVCEKLCLNFKDFHSGILNEYDYYNDFFKNGEFEVHRFENNILFNLHTFIGRNLSASCAPKESDADYQDYINGLTDLFNKFSINGALILPHITTCYIGEV